MPIVFGQSQLKEGDNPVTGLLQKPWLGHFEYFIITNLICQLQLRLKSVKNHTKAVIFIASVPIVAIKEKIPKNEPLEISSDS